MILEQEGIPAVGIVGVSAFKPEWIPQLKPFQVHVALDNDSVGQKGAERIRQLFHEHDQPVRILSLPQGFNDVNDLVAAREVLPGFLSSRQTLMHRLEASFPEHSKDRTNSFLTIVVLIMRALVKLLEGLADLDPRTWEILSKLIKEQGEIAEDTERETNPATYLLDALAHEVRTKGSGLVDKQYYVQSQAVVDEAGELKEVHLVAPAKDFYLAFVTLSRNRGYAVPFMNAKSLMARINSEKEALAASGWR